MTPTSVVPVRPSPATRAASATTPPGTAVRVPILAALFVGLFGVLLASSPARDLAVWKHIAGGRNLFQDGFSPTWLYDLGSYAVYAVAGGGGLVAVKAVLCGLVGVLLLRLSSASGWRLALAMTGLAVLAMGGRLLLHPETASVVLMAVALWVLHRPPDRPTGRWPLPDWRLVAVVVVWANVDGRFVLGVAVIALTLLGRALDDRAKVGLLKAFERWVIAVVVLAAAACLSPSHVNGLNIPADIDSAMNALTKPAGETPTVYSPFDTDFFVQFRDSSAALAFYPLLALGLFSFVLNRKGWRWAWALPWLALAVVAAVQVRTVPLFAVVAGPVTAWNLQAYFTRRGIVSKPPRPWVRMAGYALTGVAAVVFLVAAWPGWLQGPPYEPRRWAVECPPAVQQGAEFIKQTHVAKLWDDGTRTLHVSPETQAAFAVFAPDDPRVQDDTTVNLLLEKLDHEKAREALRALKVTRVVLWAGDARQVNVLDRLLAEPAEWRQLSLHGGLVVFGWNDPKHPTAERFAGREVDFDRLAFRPDESEVAPAPRSVAGRQWWEVFWTPADPPRSPARDEATVLLRKALADRDAAPVRHLTEWENGQLAGLVGAGAGWAGPGAGLDAALRLTLFRPPVPPPAHGNRPPPQTDMTFTMQKRFANDRGSIPVGVGYAAVRAARRAVADNPTDATAYLVLGRAYSLLLSGTAEHEWAARIPQIKRVREDQQVAAFNRAVTLDPKLAAAHLELARLYRSNGCIDLAADHLKTYLDLPPRWGGPKKGSELAEASATEWKQLTQQVESRTRTWEEETARQPVGDRALRAQQMELGRLARDLLLKSDVAAFGKSGTELEIDLLLRTGRPQDVLDWLTPEVAGSLDSVRQYHWRRAEAYLAVGDYAAADEELALMVSGDGKLTDPKLVVSEVGALLGKAVLDIGPGVPPLQQWTWNEVNRADMELSFNKFPKTLRLQADMQVLRGVMALEGGNRERAADVFRNALTFSPNPSGGGQLEFGGRTIARDCLGWLSEK